MQTEQNTATCNASAEHESWAVWRLCPELTVKQAALLIAGADPSPEEVDVERRHPSQWSPVYEAAKAALKAALRQGLIEGAIVPEYGEDYNGNCGAQIPGTVDIHLSTVDPQSVRRYLEQSGFRRGFFFPDAPSVPAYLDRTHPCYAPKLAAAVAAWEAAVSDPKYVNNGKHVKQNMEDFLTAHAAEYELVKDDGSINYDAIKNQIAKVANWNEKGGAPRTPEGNPPVTQVAEE